MRVSVMFLMLLVAAGCRVDPDDTGDTTEPECTVAADCDDPSSACMEATCDDGVCGEAPLEAGTVLADPVAGDCQRAVCDGVGGITSAADNTDTPTDTECSTGTCTNGTPGFADLDAGTACGAGDANVCDGEGECVECIAAADCPGTDDECQERTCEDNECGMSYTNQGVAITTQVDDDCATAVCDGDGDVEQVADSTDRPANTDCTTYTCDGLALDFTHASENDPCAGGTMYCNGVGACVECNLDDQCTDFTGDPECGSNECVDNGCSVDQVAAGTPVPSATPEPCRAIVCDEDGERDDIADDSNERASTECTTYSCDDGVEQEDFANDGDACSLQAGGDGVCDGLGECVGCTDTSFDHCPFDDNGCQAPRCDGGSCDVANVGEGEPAHASVQTDGDCKQLVCAGDGSAPTQIADPPDRPEDEDCAEGICTGENFDEPGYDPVPPDSACLGDAEGYCTVDEVCVECTLDEHCDDLVSELPEGCEVPRCTENACELEFAPETCDPFVASTEPFDGEEEVSVATPIYVTFSEAMFVDSLTAQTEVGACTGTVQLSYDDFLTCVPFTTADPVMTEEDTVAMWQPAQPLLYDRIHEIRVTTAAQDSDGNAMLEDQDFIFATEVFDGVCGEGVIISQVYGGGGNSGAFYKRDFIELFNTTPEPISLVGWSVQYASAGGSTWSSTPITTIGPSEGVIPAYGYFLVGAAQGSGGSEDLPPLDTDGGLTMAATNFKVALVDNTTLLAGGCPLDDVVDFVGTGSANCPSSTAPVGSNSTSLQRKYSGCQRTGDLSTDFVSAFPFPRNSASTTATCSCAGDVVQNGTGSADEVDYCALLSAEAIAAPNGLSSTEGDEGIWAAIFEPGLTEAGDESLSILAQIGYGPLGSDPRAQQSWVFFDADFDNAGGDNDNHYYEGFIVAPVAPADYAMTYRFSIDGMGWTYCDLDGAGSNSDVDFSPTDLGTLAVE